MRVLYCTDTYPPQVNGVSIVTAALRRRPQRALGWSAPSWRRTIRAAPTRMRSEVPLGEVPGFASLPCRAIPRFASRSPASSRVGAVIDGFRPDLVHCETEFGIGRAGNWPRRGRGAPHGLVLSHGLRAIRRGVRGPLARARVAGLSSARFHRPSRRSVHAVERRPQDAAVASGTPSWTWRSGAAGWTPSAFHPGRRTRRLRGRVRDGEPVHLPLCRTAGAGEAGRPGRGCLPAGERDAAPRRDPSRLAGARVHARPSCARPRRPASPSWACWTDVAAFPTSTPTATHSCSPR